MFQLLSCRLSNLFSGYVAMVFFTTSHVHIYISALNMFGLIFVSLPLPCLQIVNVPDNRTLKHSRGEGIQVPWILYMYISTSHTVLSCPSHFVILIFFLNTVLSFDISFLLAYYIL